MKTLMFALLSFLLVPQLLSQNATDSSNSFIFLPAGHHIPPLKANIQEARIGLFKFIDDSDMRVDIGNSIDLFDLRLSTPSLRLTLGIDFMAYAFVTSSQGLHLQIDAVDGFFGGNISVTKKFDENSVQARLRILHHSAHLVDGHVDYQTLFWLGNRAPIPYSRDFGEITLLHNMNSDFGHVRYYGGFSYATLVRPAEIHRIGYLAGGEIYFDKLFGGIQQHPTNIFLAYHVALTGTPTYQATHQIQTGIKFGTWDEKGLSIFASYYTGRQMFGEYFDVLQSVVGIGFTVDFN